MLSQLILHLRGQIFRFRDHMMIHKRIVFSVNNQRRFSNLVKQRHGATLTIVVDGVGKAVNFRGDQVVKLANTAH